MTPDAPAEALPSGSPFELPVSAAHMSSEAVLRQLGTDQALGLTSEETSARLARFGPNELEPVRKTSIARLFWEGAREPFVVLLFIAGCLAIALNEVRDGLLVLVILAPIVAPASSPSTAARRPWKPCGMRRPRRPASAATGESRTCPPATSCRATWSC